ncbi:MAG: DsrE family protein [Planctomycetota bacterium]
MTTLLVLKRAQLGVGDTALGQKVLGTFLRKAIALRDLDTIAMFNEGVKLVAQDSPVRAELAMLEERGVDLMPCGTCLEHYGVEPVVGKVSDMDAILKEMDQAGKVIDL